MLGDDPVCKATTCTEREERVFVALAELTYYPKWYLPCTRGVVVVVSAVVATGTVVSTEFLVLEMVFSLTVIPNTDDASAEEVGSVSG